MNVRQQSDAETGQRRRKPRHWQRGLGEAERVALVAVAVGERRTRRCTGGDESFQQRAAVQSHRLI
jgi:hypothetical protein